MARALDVALVTCVNLPEPDHDEAFLVDALRRLDLDVRVVAWDDTKVDWSRVRVSVIRSTWNYYRYPDTFLTWAESTARVSRLWNPLPVVRWNAHKAYLLTLAELGVPIVPTRLVRRGAPSSLQEAAGEWPTVVVKPAVSAASFNTHRVDPTSWLDGERRFKASVADYDVLVQPYVGSVEAYGERSLVWIDGHWTHAVRKSARFADDVESVSDALPIAADELAVGQRAIEAAVALTQQPLLYARVDVVRDDRHGRPMVAELELIEPSLFLRQAPAAVETLAEGIRRRRAAD